jgi:hypothetical protein
LLSIKEKKEEVKREWKEKGVIIQKQSPVYTFIYALRSSEARRQYPKRLKMLFDFLDLSG